MNKEEQIGEFITQTYTSLIKSVVHLKYPNFFFERGVVFYDYDHERYVYSGYSEDEMNILKEAEKSLQQN